MKKLSFSLVMLLFIVALTANCVKAQEGDKGKEHHGFQRGERLKKLIPDLTDDQITKIKQISLDHKKAVMETRNLMREKDAHLQTLQTKDNPNMAEINKTIDEIGALRTQLQKSSAQHRQDVRNLLTPAQKVAFDQIKPEQFGEGRHKGGRGGRPGDCKDKD